MASRNRRFFGRRRPVIEASTGSRKSPVVLLRSVGRRFALPD